MCVCVCVCARICECATCRTYWEAMNSFLPFPPAMDKIIKQTELSSLSRAISQGE